MDTVYISIFNLILSSVTVILRNAQGAWHTKNRIKRYKKLKIILKFSFQGGGICQSVWCLPLLWISHSIGMNILDDILFRSISKEFKCWQLAEKYSLFIAQYNLCCIPGKGPRDIRIKLITEGRAFSKRMPNPRWLSFVNPIHSIGTLP